MRGVEQVWDGREAGVLFENALQVSTGHPSGGGMSIDT